MKSSRRKKDVLLSRNNAKALFVRNAHDTVLLEKEERLLERAWSTEDKTFQKKREHLLQRQLDMAEELSASRRSEKPDDSNKKRHAKISASLSLPVITVTQSKSSGIFDNSQPSRRRSAPVSASSHHLSPHQLEINGRRNSVVGWESNLRLSVSLPDVNTHNGSITGPNKLPRSTKLLENSLRAKSCQEIRAEELIDGWKELRKCRYLRTLSAETKSTLYKECNTENTSDLFAFGDLVSAKE